MNIHFRNLLNIGKNFSKFFIARCLLIIGISLCVIIYVNKNDVSNFKVFLVSITPVFFILSLALFLLALGENSVKVDLTETDKKKYEIRKIRFINTKGIVYLGILLFIVPITLFSISRYKGYPFYDILYFYIFLTPGYAVLFSKLKQKAP